MLAPIGPAGAEGERKRVFVFNLKLLSQIINQLIYIMSCT